MLLVLLLLEGLAAQQLRQSIGTILGRPRVSPERDTEQSGAKRMR